MTGVKRFVAAMEVSSAPFVDTTEIWSGEEYPRRVRVKPLHLLNPDTAVLMDEILRDLTIFDADKPYSTAWTGYIRSSPTRWKQSDGERVERALKDAVTHPTVRPIASRLSTKKLAAYDEQCVIVTVPEPEPPSTQLPNQVRETSAVVKEESEHTRIGSGSF